MSYHFKSLSLTDFIRVVSKLKHGDMFFICFFPFLTRIDHSFPQNLLSCSTVLSLPITELVKVVESLTPDPNPKALSATQTCRTLLITTPYTSITLQPDPGCSHALGFPSSSLASLSWLFLTQSSLVQVICAGQFPTEELLMAPWCRRSKLTALQTSHANISKILPLVTQISPLFQTSLFSLEYAVFIAPHDPWGRDFCCEKIYS